MHKRVLLPSVFCAAILSGGCGDKSDNDGSENDGSNGAGAGTGVVGEPSPRLRRVARNLGEAGAHYSLTDINGDIEKLAALIDAGLQMSGSGGSETRLSGPAGSQPRRSSAFPNLNVERLVGDLKLHYITAVGRSVHQSGPYWHQRSFLATGGKRTGVLSILGGAGEPYFAPTYAPADADLVLELELNLKEVRDLASRVAAALGPEARQSLTESLAEGVLNTTLSLGDMLGKFELRGSLALTLNPRQTIQLPDGPTIPGLSVVGRVDNAKWVWDTFSKKIAEEMELEIMSAGGLESITAPEPMETPLGEFTPVIAFEKKSGVIWFSLNEKDLSSVREGGKTLAGNADFQKAMAGLPAKGNALAYTSKRFSEEIGKLIKEAQKDMEEEAVHAMSLVSKLLLPDMGEPRAYAAVIANNDDGILLAMNGPVKGNALTGGSIGSVAALAAFATPQIFKATQRASAVENINNARQLKLALDAYAADNDGDFPESLEGLIPDIMDRESYELLKMTVGKEPKPWMYVEGLENISKGDLIILFAPAPIDGKRIVVRVDGSARPIPEAEFQALIEEQ